MPQIRTTTSPTTRVSGETVDRLRLAVLRTARNIRTHSIGDVTQSQIAVLATLARHGDSTVGQIAEHERVQPPSASRIVAHLEDRGLVERHPDAHDRRRVLIALSPAGAEYVARVRAAGTTWLGSRLDRLDADDLGRIDAALAVLEKLLALDEEDSP